MKIFITGSSGFIGFHLSKKLLDKGHKVHGFDSMNNYYDIRLKKARYKILNKYKEFSFTKGKLESQKTLSNSILKFKPKIIIHLAAQAGVRYSIEKPRVYLNSNISGTYNLFEACRINRVKRIIFASSAHVIGFHNRKNRIDEKCTLRPDSHYAVSKCFGEALASLYSDKYDIKTMSIRIGSVLPQPTDERFLSTWISFRDLVHLVDIGLKSSKLHCSVVYGISKNKRSWWKNNSAYKLGYKPKDNAEKFIKNSISKNERKDSIALKFHGGVFTSDKFKGNLRDILKK